jgi:hypothetical protein
MVQLIVEQTEWNPSMTNIHMKVVCKFGYCYSMKYTWISYSMMRAIGENQAQCVHRLLDVSKVIGSLFL